MSRGHRVRARWLLVGVLAGWAAPAVAHACSCTRPPPPLAAAEGADVVFEGRASAPLSEGMRLRTTFEVLRTFKGQTGTHVDVLTMNSSAACGRRYVPRETYLVYAFQSNGALSDNLCSRTRRSAEATLDFAALGTGIGPKPIPEADEAPSNVEPPRIAPDAPPTVAPSRRGCAASVGLPHGGAGLWLGLLGFLGVASLRRDAYRDR